MAIILMLSDVKLVFFNNDYQWIENVKLGTGFSNDSEDGIIS
jgi:hypothetical protein